MVLLERGVWAISNGKNSCLLKRLDLRLLYCNFNVKINKGYVGSDAFPSLIQLPVERYFMVFLKFFCYNYTLYKFGFLESQRLKTVKI